MDPEHIDTSADDQSAVDTSAATETPPAGEGGSAETLLDAINEGIADAGPNPKTEAPAGDGTEEPPGDEAPTRDAQGRFVPKGEQPAAKPGEAKDVKPGEQPPGDGKPAVKQPDVINDPIPDDVKGKTRERMESLIKTAKDLTTARDQAVADRGELLGYVAETKATPQQFTEALNYLKAVNSGDPVQIRQAIKMAQAELTALARIIGEPVQGVDLLAEHQDLKDAVEAGDISRQHAEELAASRALRAQQQQTSRQQTEQSQVQQDITGGKTALNTLDGQLRAADPQYEAKRALLVPLLQPIFAQLHPSKWAGAFKEAYDKLPATAIAPATAATAAIQQRTPTQQPLRAKQTAGQAAKAPGSLMDAINMGIEAAGR